MNLDSDYKVAVWLGVSRQYMTKIRNGQPMGAKQCIRIAKALKRDPLELIATSESQKEKDIDIKAIWIKLAKEKGNTDSWKNI
jgi:hypothetical protein